MFFPASAARTLRFIITSARCCVASFNAWVHCWIASRSVELDHVLQAGERLFDPLLLAGGELGLCAIAGKSGERSDFSVAGNHALRLVPGLDQQPRREVGFRMLERLEQHALDLVVGEP